MSEEVWIVRFISSLMFHSGTSFGSSVPVPDLNFCLVLAVQVPYSHSWAGTEQRPLGLTDGRPQSV